MSAPELAGDSASALARELAGEFWLLQAEDVGRRFHPAEGRDSGAVQSRARSRQTRDGARQGRRQGVRGVGAACSLFFLAHWPFRRAAPRSSDHYVMIAFEAGGERRWHDAMSEVNARVFCQRQRGITTASDHILIGMTYYQPSPAGRHRPPRRAA